MPETRREILIDRPPKEVFAFATDLAGLPGWMPGVTAIQLHGDGPIQVGTVFTETRRMKGRELTADIRVTEHGGPEQGFDPPYVHAVTSKAAGVLLTYRTFFHKDKSGTRVDQRVVAEPVSLFGRLAASGLLRVANRVDGGTLERLKEAVEAS